jgi:hypothetical protein
LGITDKLKQLLVGFAPLTTCIIDDVILLAVDKIKQWKEKSGKKNKTESMFD